MRRVKGKGRRLLGAMLSVGLVASLSVPASASAVGYRVEGIFLANGLGGAGLGISQSTGAVYVPNSFSPKFSSPWQITSFDAKGKSSATFIGGVLPVATAVDQSTHNVIALQGSAEGQVIATYTSSGVPVGSPYYPFPEFQPGVGVQIATDSAGNVYVPGGAHANQVRKFSSSGVEANGAFPLTCSACPAPAEFSTPTDVSVDSAGNIYVADSGNGRVVKFDSAGENPTVFRTGASNFLAIDTNTGEVFVSGDDGGGPHVTGYDSSGTEIADFGEGELISPFGPLGVAVNESTGIVYVRGMTESFIGLVWMYVLADPPLVSTEAAEDVASSTATLTGSVNPEKAKISDCHFEYGPTAAYGSVAPCEPAEVGEGDEAVEVSAAIAGLSASSEYHFRLVAENVGGKAEGDDEMFTTLPSKPVISGEKASAIAQRSASLSGLVDPKGTSTTCTFEYGTSTAYGTTVPCANPPGSGEGSVAVSIPALSGLAPATTYHFRINATNAGGSANGPDQTFATLADTCQTNAALCPPPAAAPVSTPAPKPAPRKCRQGFKKKTANGKVRCVKVRKKHRGR